MKRLLLPLLAALALPTAVNANWFGKYASQVEAEEACNKWVDKGFKYSYEGYSLKDILGINQRNKPKKLITIESNNRWCRHEVTTRQYLGYERTGVKRNQDYTEDEYRNLKTKKVIKKYFRY